MNMPADIRINTSVPFPSLVNSTAPITIAKNNGIWSVGLSLATLGAVTPLPGDLPTDYLLVWNSILNTYSRISLSAISATTSFSGGIVLPATMPLSVPFSGVGPSASGLASMTSFATAISPYKFEWNVQVNVTSHVGGLVSPMSTVTYNSSTGVLTLTFASAPFGADITGPIGTQALVYNITGGFANGAWSIATISPDGKTIALQANAGLGALTLSGGLFTPNANKGALYAAGIAEAGSSEIFAANFIASAGTGFLHTSTGLEIDVNNGAQNYGAVRYTYDGGVTPQQYGLTIASSSSADGVTGFVSTAAIYITALGSPPTIGGGAWRYGVIFDGASTGTASILDAGWATNSYLDTGHHTTGINLGGATLATSIILPNNAPIQQNDALGTPRTLINLDNTGEIGIGDGVHNIFVFPGGAMAPALDNAVDSGGPANRWRSVYAGNVLASNVGQLTYKASVNFNAANTDTSIAISLPPGITRYVVNGVRINKASASITTATCGLFTAAAGGGIAIVAGGSAITVSASAANTNNNTQVLTVANTATEAYDVATLFFRVGTAQGSATTADVLITILPLT